MSEDDVFVSRMSQHDGSLEVARASTGCSTRLEALYPERPGPSMAEGPVPSVSAGPSYRLQVEMDVWLPDDSTLILRGLARSLSGITSDRTPFS